MVQTMAFNTEECSLYHASSEPIRLKENMGGLFFFLENILLYSMNRQDLSTNPDNKMG